LSILLPSVLPPQRFSIQKNTPGAEALLIVMPVAYADAPFLAQCGLEPVRTRYRPVLTHVRVVNVPLATNLLWHALVLRGASSDYRGSSCRLGDRPTVTWRHAVCICIVMVKFIGTIQPSIDTINKLNVDLTQQLVNT
jgi:hypothetical protein